MARAGTIHVTSCAIVRAMKPITEVAASLGLDPAHLEVFGLYKAKVARDRKSVV